MESVIDLTLLIFVTDNFQGTSPGTICIPGVDKNEKTANDQDLHIRLGPEKDILLTVSPDGPANSIGVTYIRILMAKRTC